MADDATTADLRRRLDAAENGNDLSDELRYEPGTLLAATERRCAFIEACTRY